MIENNYIPVVQVEKESEQAPPIFNLSLMSATEGNMFFYRETQSGNPESDYHNRKYILEMANWITDYLNSLNPEQSFEKFILDMFKRAVDNPFNLSDNDWGAITSITKIPKDKVYDFARILTLIKQKNDVSIWEIKDNYKTLSPTNEQSKLSFSERKVSAMAELEHKVLSYIETHGESILNQSDGQIYEQVLKLIRNDIQSLDIFLTSSEERALRLSIILWLQKLNFIKKVNRYLNQHTKKEFCQELLGVEVSEEAEAETSPFGITIFLNDEDFYKVVQPRLQSRVSDNYIKKVGGLNLNTDGLSFNGDAVPGLISLVRMTNSASDFSKKMHEEQHTLFSHLHHVEAYYFEKNTNDTALTIERKQLEQRIKDEMLAWLAGGSSFLPDMPEAFYLDTWFGNEQQNNILLKLEAEGKTDELKNYYKESIILIRNVLTYLSAVSFVDYISSNFGQYMSNQPVFNNAKKYFIALLSNTPMNKMYRVNSIILSKIPSTFKSESGELLISTSIGFNQGYNMFPTIASYYDDYQKKLSALE